MYEEAEVNVQVARKNGASSANGKNRRRSADDDINSGSLHCRARKKIRAAIAITVAPVRSPRILSARIFLSSRRAAMLSLPLSFSLAYREFYYAEKVSPEWRRPRGRCLLFAKSVLTTTPAYSSDNRIRPTRASAPALAVYISDYIRAREF